MRRIQSLPGVNSAAAVTSLPSGWTWNWTGYSAEGQPPARPGEMPSTISQVVSPDLFTTLRVPLLKGRFISAQDGPDAPPVAVISETMARYNWPGQDPIGKHLRLGDRGSSEPARQIVGVVGDVRPSPFDLKPEPTTYTPFAQVADHSSAFVVRTSGDPLRIVALVNSELKAVDADVPAYDVRTLEQVISDNLSGVDFSARMMMVFGMVAVVLSAAGIFAVMAYSVSQRTHEIGVRMALGARRVDVLRLVVTSAIRMAIAGLAIGVGIALLLTHALSSLLFGIVRIDPAVFALLTFALAAVATLAAYIPARSATKVDPMQALRYE
jgi:putative ABC transport system permease protein